MPIIYARDDESRYVSLTLSGPFDMSEVMEARRRQQNDGASGYAVLVDTRGLTSAAKVSELSEFIQADMQERTTRGPVAIVARDAEVYAMSCAYATMLGSRHPMQVFIDMDDAMSWLQSKGGCRPPLMRHAG
ncbi:MAG: hypothetical protein ACRD1U_17645 [Vicinamibacterales bacterium]